MGTHLTGVIPPFRAAERDRWSVASALGWRPSDRVWLDLYGDWLSENRPAGHRVSGPGDFRLGTRVRAWRGWVDLDLGWRLKLPNAQDEGELGTDETDGTVWLGVGKEIGDGRVGLDAGLAILGNPLRFANQDDVPMGWLTGSVPVGAFNVAGRVGGGMATSRNPARLESRLGIEGRCPVLSGVEGRVGMSPAAPDWGITAWIGWGGGCSVGSAD